MMMGHARVCGLLGLCLFGCSAPDPVESTRPGQCDPLDASPLTDPDFIAQSLAHVSTESCGLDETVYFWPDAPVPLDTSAGVKELEAACEHVDAGCRDLCVATAAAEVGRRLYFGVAGGMGSLLGRNSSDESCGDAVLAAGDQPSAAEARELWACFLPPLPERLTVQMTISDLVYRNNGQLRSVRHIVDVALSGRFLPPVPGLAPAELSLSTVEQWMGCGTKGRAVVLEDHPLQSPGSTVDYCVEQPNPAAAGGDFYCTVGCGDALETCGFHQTFVPPDEAEPL